MYRHCCSHPSIWLMYCCDWGRSLLQCAIQTFTERYSCSQTAATHPLVLHCTSCTLVACMGTRRHGQGDTSPLWKCCKVFCALAVTAKTCFEACFEGHLPSPWKCRNVFCALIVKVKTCVLRVTTKKGRQLF